jgi:hypothetical protein
MKHKNSAILILIIGLIFAAQITLFAEPDVFTEPFTETRLDLLQARISKLKELHVFNYQSCELA